MRACCVCVSVCASGQITFVVSVVRDRLQPGVVVEVDPLLDAELGDKDLEAEQNRDQRR